MTINQFPEGWGEDRVRRTLEHDERGRRRMKLSPRTRPRPTLPGCRSQGDTRDEAIANVTDAIRGYMESLKKHSEPIPFTITEEVIEVEV